MVKIRLREWRIRRLLTQVELAERSGVSEVTINRIERGHAEGRISTLRKLAAALDVTPEQLLVEEEPESKRAA